MLMLEVGNKAKETKLK